jgi:beta-glucosidase
MQEKKFPDGFYWGAATASYQVEGNIFNTDWSKAAAEGRVPPADASSDHYNRYKEDFDIAQSLSHNAHRFSLEWARIEPEEGRFDQEAISHYRDVLMELNKRGLKPFVTIWHFTLPLWFAEKGGFERKDAYKIFSRYAAFVTKELGDLTLGMSTMNEPIVFASNGWLRGTWPPFKRFSLTDKVKITNSGKQYDPRPTKGLSMLFTYLRVVKNLAKAHNAAQQTIKKIRPDMEVSIITHIILFHADSTLKNRLIAAFANYHWTFAFMNRVHKYCDSIGVNYYVHKKFGDTVQYEKTDMDWDIYPEGLYDVLMMLTRYQKPLFVSEAGIADKNDIHRAQYIKKQVAAMWQAIQDGADVRGHLYWSLLDNYEWALGYEKCFGLIDINYETLERKIRPSAYTYQEIIRSNSVIE